MKLKILAGATLLGLALVSWALAASAPGIPKYEPDPYWPKPLPNNWMFGEVSGVEVDSHDHIWVTHRPRTLTAHDKYASDSKGDCCVPAPAVVEFDQAGNVVQAWGGPGPGYDWPESNHGITIDHKGNVWIAAGGGGQK